MEHKFDRINELKDGIVAIQGILDSTIASLSNELKIAEPMSNIEVILSLTLMSALKCAGSSLDVAITFIDSYFVTLKKQSNQNEQ